MFGVFYKVAVKRILSGRRIFRCEFSAKILANSASGGKTNPVAEGIAPRSCKVPAVKSLKQPLRVCHANCRRCFLSRFECVARFFRLSSIVPFSGVYLTALSKRSASICRTLSLLVCMEYLRLNFCMKGKIVSQCNVLISGHQLVLSAG